jgi:hypothetical protein
MTPQQSAPVRDMKLSEWLNSGLDEFMCCRRLRFDPDAEILVNRPIVDLILEWEAFTSSPPGSSTRRQLVQFGVGSNICRRPDS